MKSSAWRLATASFGYRVSQSPRGTGAPVGSSSSHPSPGSSPGPVMGIGQRPLDLRISSWRHYLAEQAHAGKMQQAQRRHCPEAPAPNRPYRVSSAVMAPVVVFVVVGQWLLNRICPSRATMLAATAGVVR